MKSEILINAGIHETRIAILEDSKLVEIWVESPDNERMVGDIYKGKVDAVIPGIQAAFVDIGLGKSAFLHVSDVSGGSIDFAAQYETEDDDEDDDSVNESDDSGKSRNQSYQRRGKSNKGSGGAGKKDDNYAPIESILKKGQTIIVQITKEPISTKGARVTSEISLPGRFLVLVPGGSKIGVSRKIESRKESRRLKQIARQHKPEGFGLIIRTVAEGKGEEEFINELKELKSTYDALIKRADEKPTPALIHKEIGMTSGIIRDLLSEDFEKVVVDSKEHYDEMCSYLKTTSPNLLKKVELYQNKEPIFDFYNIEREIEGIFSRKTWLKKGGFLVFDHTEALTVIDVNSGRYLGKSKQEETILETNKEAAIEIARQLRLRDIGGIIVIDFIDMASHRHRRTVEDVFADALRNDRSRVSISQISEFGLMEMTRQRVRHSLIHTFSETCPTCNGIGMVPGRETTVSRIERWLRRAEGYGNEKSYTIFMHPAVFTYLHENDEEKLTMLRSSTNLNVDPVVDAKLAIDEYYCYSSTRNVDVTNDFKVGTTPHSNGSIKVKVPEPKRSFTSAGDSEKVKYGRKKKPKTRR